MNRKLFVATLSVAKFFTIITCQVLFISSVPVDSSVNIYFSSLGLSSTIYLILYQPFDLIFSPKIKSSLSLPNFPTTLTLVIRQKNQALIAIFFCCTLLFLTFYFPARLYNFHDLSSWSLFLSLGLIISLLTALNSQLLLLIRLKKRIAFASLLNSLMTITINVLSLAMALDGGINAYVISYIILTFLFTIILFAIEPQAFPGTWHKVHARGIEKYFSFLSLTILSKSVGLSESLSISLFGLNSAAYYFLAKKAIASFLTILNESYCQYITVDVLHNLSKHKYSNACSMISKLRFDSIMISLIYALLFTLLYVTTPYLIQFSSFAGIKANINNVLMTSIYCLVFTPYFFSNITGPTLSESVYALGLVNKIRKFISYSSVYFIIIIIIGSWMFGAVATIILVSSLYIVNNIYFSKVISGYKNVNEPCYDSII